MSVANPCSRSCAQPASRSVNARRGASFPASLALLWSSTKYAKSLKGSQPVYTDVPTVTSDGVTPGDGPSFTSVVTWTAGGTRMVRFTASSASADLVGDVEIGGGFYAASTGLKFKDGTNTAACATSWEADEVVTAIVTVFDDGVRDLMRVQRGEAM